MDSNGEIDLARFTENRRRISDEALRPYKGRYVAFSLDGTRVIADGADPDELWANLQKSGADLRCVASEYIFIDGEEAYW